MPIQDVDIRLKEIIASVYDELGVEPIELELMPDHVSSAIFLKKSDTPDRQFKGIREIHEYLTH